MGSYLNMSYFPKDNTPIDASTNVIESNAVFDAIATRQPLNSLLTSYVSQVYDLQRTVPSVVNNTVDIGSFTCTVGSINLDIAITTYSSGFGMAKRYVITKDWPQSGDSVWFIVPTTAEHGPYNTEDFRLEMRQVGAVLSLRIRRTGFVQYTGSAFIHIETMAPNITAFTPSTTETSAVADITAYIKSQSTFVQNSILSLYSVGSNSALTNTDTISGAFGKIQAMLLDKYAYSTSRSANTVLAAPDGVAGSATFRTLIASDIPSITSSKISDFSTASIALVTGAASTVVTSNLGTSLALASNASGKITTATATLTELNYLSGVTASIQSQLNSKIGSVIDGESYIPDITVRAVSNANVTTLSGIVTVDATITLVIGDRVLLKNQTTASQNGVYTVASGAWSRTLGFDSDAEIRQRIVLVTADGTNAKVGYEYICTNTSTITPGTTSITFAQVPFGIGTAANMAAAGNHTQAATAGGTGLTSYAKGDLLYASSASAIAKLADVATGNVLISGGVGDIPSYGKVGLTTHISGILPVANGGLNLSAIVAFAMPYASAANTYSTLSPNVTTTRKFMRMVGDGTNGSAPVWDTVTSTDVGLSLVENTKLSTWTGSTSITTVGDSAVLSKPLTGYALGTNASLAATDTVLSAMGKIQAQINAKALGGTGTLNYLTKFTASGMIGDSTLVEDTDNYLLTTTSRIKIMGGAQLGDYANSGADFAIYTGGSIPGGSNYSLYSDYNASLTTINSSGSVHLAIATGSKLEANSSNVISKVPFVVLNAATLSVNPGTYGALQVDSVKGGYHGIALNGAKNAVFMSDTTNGYYGIYSANGNASNGAKWLILGNPDGSSTLDGQVKISDLNATCITVSPSLGTAGAMGAVNMRGKSFFDMQSSGTSMILGLGDIGQIVTVVSNNYTSSGARVTWFARTTSGEQVLHIDIDRCKAGLFQCVYQKDSTYSYWQKLN